MMMMMMSSDDNRNSSDSPFGSEHEEFYGQVREDFTGKLQIDGSNDDGLQQRELEHEASSEPEEEHDDDEDFEFSFACVNPDGSPISADDAFQNGQIHPTYPLFDQSLLFGDCRDEAPKTAAKASNPRPPLKKLFVETAEPDQLEGVEEGTYCVWKGKTVEEAASPEGCRKSNSTGSSRLWRFRDLVHRSSSDGKDAFVFMSTHNVHGQGGRIPRAKKDEEVGRAGGGRTATSKEGKAKSTATVTSSAKGKPAHEKHYVRSRAAKESDKRKSYLPYRQDLVGVGFFANVSGMTRNLHPF